MPASTTHMSPAQARRAYRLGIANGVLFAMGTAFIDPVTVLPSLVARLSGGSDFAVGLLSAIGMSGWFLPQLVIAKYLQPHPHKRPFYIGAAVVRAVALVSVVPPMLLLGGSRPAVALAAFFIGYSVYSLSGGMSGPAFLDIVAKTVPGSRLGAYFGQRQFWGGLGAIGSGAVVRLILSSEAIGFPANYALFFVIDLVVAVPAFALFAMIHEPPGAVTEPQPLPVFLRGAPEIIRRDRQFRLLLACRLLIGSVSIALPFYMIYCRRVLHVPEAMAGTYVSVQMAGSVLFMPLWAYLNDRKGPRALIVALSAVYLLVVALALTASLFPAATGFGRAAFLAVFFPLAAVGGGGFMGFTNYLFTIAPDDRRTLYIGIHNTLFALTAFLPMVGGAIVGRTSFPVLFGVALAFAGLGLASALRLPRPAPHASSVPL